MSSFEIKKITDRAGTGSPNFTNGVSISGTDSGLLAPIRTEGDTQPDPETSSNGDTFYDTVNETYDILVEGAWTRVLGAGGGAANWVVDLANVTYDNVSFSVAGQEFNPTGITFSIDGTKMYMVGQSSDAVHQYTLSISFDLSTASYGSVSFSVAAQDSRPQGLVFNSDGTKMYVIGRGNAAVVYQYTLSTGFDLSTASYDNVSFSVAGQDGNPTGLFLNPDGNKMYIVGYNSDTAHQYTLSTGFDLGTASYDSVSFSVADQEAAPQGLVFNSDGTKMYVMGSVSGRVHQYTLSTGFDLSTASYDSVSFSVAGQDGNPQGLSFSNDGSKMYIVGSGIYTVFQYSTGL
jgi:hypothetical protein